MEDKKITIKYVAIALFAFSAIRQFFILVNVFSFPGLLSVIGYALAAIAVWRGIPKLSAIGFGLLTINALSGISSALNWIEVLGLGSDSYMIKILLANIVLVCVYILLICASMNIKSAKKLALLAAGFEAFCFLIYLPSMNSFFHLVHLVASVLLGFVYDDIAQNGSEEKIVLPNISVNGSDIKINMPTTNNTSPLQKENNIEKLLQLKALLDNGVITQEDFEAKKKELLNL